MRKKIHIIFSVWKKRNSYFTFTNKNVGRRCEEIGSDLSGQAMC